MKHYLFFIFAFGLVLSSCSKSQSEESKIRLRVAVSNATTTTAKSNLLTGKINENVIFTSFRISIRDVVFKNDDDPNSDLATDEVQFKGPYQLDLINGGDLRTQTIGDAVVPDGRYKEVRFKFHKDEDLPQTDSLFDRSIYIEGTINDIPFIFWHDTSENLDVARTTGVQVSGGVINFTLNFQMDQFLSALKEIDLNLAADGNENGIIEIYPNDTDGNQEIAKDLKDNIKATADLLNE